MHTIELNPSMKLKEFRHPINKNLLCKAIGKWHIEVYDKKSRQTIYTWPTREHNDIWPKWAEFQTFSRDFRCPKCTRLLGRGLWYGLVVEIKCTHCKEAFAYRMKNLYDTSFATLPTLAQEKLRKKIKDLTF